MRLHGDVGGCGEGGVVEHREVGDAGEGGVGLVAVVLEDGAGDLLAYDVVVAWFDA